MQRKESTPMRENRRKYEELHKKERQAKNRVWGTSLVREYADEIDEFLRDNQISKVTLITEGYKALKEQIEKKN